MHILNCIALIVLGLTTVCRTERCSYTFTVDSEDCSSNSAEVEALRSRVDVLTQQVDTLAEKYEQLLSDLVEAKRLNEMDASAVSQDVLLACDFEDSDCPELQNDNSNEIDWARISNGTPTEFTGPSTGASDSTFYIYFESSSDVDNDVGRLVSPVLGASGETCVAFFYHMYGEDVRGLVLLLREGENQVSKDTVLWSILEGQPNQWLRFQRTVEMNPEQRLVWQAFNGKYQKGDIALDSILVTRGACPNDTRDDLVPAELVNDLSDTKPSAQSMYVRWGRTTCPNDATIVYTGFVAGGHYNHRGSTANYLCLPENPDWETPLNGFQGEAYMFQARYATREQDAFLRSNTEGVLHNHHVPCALCHADGRGLVYTFPAWKFCPDRWRLEYRGFLMTERYAHLSNKVPICVDESPEVLEHNGEPNARGALLRNMEVVCESNSTFCEAYVHGHELTCVVCTV